MTEEAVGSAHSALCLRLMQLFPRVSRGMRRWQDSAAPRTQAPLGPRHVAALEQLRGDPATVGELASRLGLTLPTVSGVLAELDRAGFVQRRPDPADRRRTIVQMTPAHRAEIVQWLDGAARPLARVLDQLDSGEQAAFLKAMSLLETELHSQGCPGEGG
jgi:DNA-binding MarR family transcriptional regulator